jgi:hypothetical protein
MIFGILSEVETSLHRMELSVRAGGPVATCQLRTVSGSATARVTPTAQPSACQNLEAPIRVAQTRLRMTALQHQRLLAQTKVFRNE